MNAEGVIQSEAFIKWFADLSNKDVGIAGGKGASLAEMYNHGFPIPPGFMITAQAYQYFIEKTGLANQIHAQLHKLNIEDTARLNEASQKIRALIDNAQMPRELEMAIIEAYDILDVERGAMRHAKPGALDILRLGHEPPFVAVRSSATTEDLESISENEHILIKVDGKPVYDEIKTIYERFGDCTLHDVEVPAMEDNQIRWHKVQKLLKHPTEKDILYRIKTVTGREITISPQHTLIILNESTLSPIVADASTMRIGTKIPVIGAIPEINNEDPIIVGDYVAGTDVVIKNNRIMIRNNSGNWSIQHGMPQKIEVSEDFAYFLGLYVSEGSTYEHQTSITNYNHALLEKAEVFCRKIGIYEKSTMNKHSIRINSPSFVRFLHKSCGEPSDKKGKGKLCRTKKVPNFVFGWSKKNIGAFLRGCFDGDGTVGRTGISYCTTSSLLAGGILKLIEILNIGFTFNNNKGIFKINILFSDSRKYNEFVGFNDSNKRDRLITFIDEYAAKEKHFDFKYNVRINPVLSASIKKQIDADLPTKEIESAFCRICGNEAGQTSYYKDKKRYYCEECNKTYYEEEVDKRILKKIDYFDDNGRFKRGATPWNYGNISGKVSLPQLRKFSDRHDIEKTFSLFNGTVKWEEIKEIIEVKNTGFLYDFSVPKVENFAGGFGGIITHNSASFAGQQDSFLAVKGKVQLIQKVKCCFSSLFTARAIYYRQKKGFEHDKAYLAVVVQKMINSQKSGVIFSKNPLKNDNTVVIEAVWGLGEGIVSGRILPDQYQVGPDTEVQEIKVADKKVAMARTSSGAVEGVKLTPERSSQQVLSGYEIKRLAQYALQLEEHYGKPQDIEFAIDREIYIVQSRPITTKAREDTREITGNVLLSGMAASPGVGSGKVRIVQDLNELDKVQQGDILVTEMTNPDMVVSMQRAAGIVTNEGGLTSHAAIVSREMGIPCIVATRNATTTLKEGQIVTVDGFTGRVIEGYAEEKKVEINPIVKTRTKIKVIVDLPDYAPRAALSGAKSVGLVRLEGIIAMGGKHPVWYIKNNKLRDYIASLSSGLKKIAAPFEEIWVRTSDIRSDEYRHLEGAPQITEGNPMLGDHGARFSVRNIDLLAAEFQAIKEVADEFPNKIIGIMMPQVISVEEVNAAKQVAQGVHMPSNTKIGIMVETPAAVQIINELCEAGIAFVSFGTNDLTQFTLAIDRNNPSIQELYNEMHPAVLHSLSYVIRRCKKYGVETSICGQAGSRPEMARFLVGEGIDSISCNADAARLVSENVAAVEASHGADSEPPVELRRPANKEHRNTREQTPSQHNVPRASMDMTENTAEVRTSEEELILKALENTTEEYNPGSETMSDVPSLNDAIPVDSEHFNLLKEDKIVDVF